MSGDGDEDQVHPAGPLEWLRDVVDRSIAMFMFRRLTGRPTEVADRRPFPPALSADEVAYRIRAPGATARPVVPSVAIAPAQSSVVRAGRQAIPRPATSGSGTRQRLIRDTGIALAGLAAVAVVAVAAWPSAQSGVLGAAATPGPYFAVAQPSESAAAAAKEAVPVPFPASSEAPVESAATTATPSETTTPEATATGGSSVIYRPPPRPGATPIPRSALTPVPRSAPTPTPPPTFNAPAKPTPVPSFGLTPTPTPESTPFLPPESTPTPTPDPTPISTPDPTPDATPISTPDAHAGPNSGPDAHFDSGPNPGPHSRALADSLIRRPLAAWRPVRPTARRGPRGRCGHDQADPGGRRVAPPGCRLRARAGSKRPLAPSRGASCALRSVGCD